LTFSENVVSLVVESGNNEIRTKRQTPER